MGGAESASENGLFQIFLQTHRPKGPDVDSVPTLLGEFSEWKRGRTGDAAIEDDFILAFDGRAFHTQSYYVGEIQNHEAIGAGCDFATAAPHLGHDPREAVRVAIDLSAYCKGPVISQTIPRGSQSPPTSSPAERLFGKACLP